MRHALAIALGLSLLAASSGARAGTHDVKWFADHEDIDVATNRSCRNNPGELAGTPNCINAEAAETEIYLRHKARALGKDCVFYWCEGRR